MFIDTNTCQRILNKIMHTENVKNITVLYSPPTIYSINASSNNEQIE